MTAILVLAKEPVPGHVKTRLCPPLEPDEASELALAALLDTLEAAAGVVGAEPVLVLDGEPGPWAPDAIRIVGQRGADHSERIENAFAGVRGSAVLIGMDTPQVTPAILTCAIEALYAADTDAVLGLADDGGWWIAGFRAYRTGAFRGVEMSTPSTGRAQVARFASLGLRTSEVPPLRDVDTFEDAVAVARSARGTRFAAVLASIERRMLRSASA